MSRDNVVDLLVVLDELSEYLIRKAVADVVNALGATYGREGVEEIVAAIEHARRRAVQAMHDDLLHAPRHPSEFGC